MFFFFRLKKSQRDKRTLNLFYVFRLFVDPLPIHLTSPKNGGSVKRTLSIVTGQKITLTDVVKVIKFYVYHDSFVPFLTVQHQDLCDL